MWIVLLFMYVFSFKTNDIVPAYNSTFLAGTVLCFMVLVKNKRMSTVLFIINQKEVYGLFLVQVLIVLYSVVITCVKGTGDFSVTKYMSLQILYMVVAVLFVTSSNERVPGRKTIYEWIIIVFMCQAGIELVSLMSPTVNSWLNVFRHSEMVERAISSYSVRFRGLAVSGSSFFGLGIGFGLILLLYIVNWKDVFKGRRTFKAFALFLIVSGGILAARSSMAGLVIGVIYVIGKKLAKIMSNFNLLNKIKINCNPKMNVRNILTYLFVVVAVFLVAGKIVQDEQLMYKLDVINKWAFQMYYNYLETGQFSTSSTDGLINEMYFHVDLDTFLFGDGKFLNENGSYYKSTDAGYMRNVLYFGIVGFVLLFIMISMNVKWGTHEKMIKNIMVMGFILVMHFKGDVLISNSMLQKILFVILLQEVVLLRRKRNSMPGNGDREGFRMSMVR